MASETKEINRRKALARLGVGAAVVYTAPVLLHLDGSAMAKIKPSPCGKGKSCPTRPTRPS